MKRLIIADILGKYDRNSGRPFGHYMNFFKQYEGVLKNFFDVRIACSNRFRPFLSSNSDYINLNYDLEYNTKKSWFGKKMGTMRQNLNLIKVLCTKGDIVILQSQDSLLPLFPLVFYFGTKKIYLVLYKNLLEGNNIKSISKRILFGLYRRNITGLITGIEEIGKSYNLPFIVLPDYFNLNSEDAFKTTRSIYDIAVLGINSRSKNLIDLVSAFRNTEYRIIIAGRFVDEDYFIEVQKMSTNNIEIINDYIDDEKYKEILNKTRFVALPYDPNRFKLQSSGVFYEALYNRKPLISSDTEFFRKVENRKIGFMYKDSISESFEVLDNKDLYKEYQENIVNYVEELNRSCVNKLVVFLNH